MANGNVLTELSPDSIALALRQPDAVVRLGEIVEDLKITPDIARELITIRPDQWTALIGGALENPAIARSGEAIWQRRAKASDAQQDRDVDDAVRGLAVAAGITGIVLGALAAIVGLIAGIAGIVAAVPTGGASLVAAIAGLFVTLIGCAMLGSSVMGLIAVLLPPNKARAIGTAIVGGAGGHAFTDDVAQVRRITQIRVRHGGLVDAIQLVWERNDGSLLEGPRRGGTGGQLTTIDLAPGERLVKVTGRSGGYVDQITFYTSTGRMLGPYGGSGGQPFELEPDYGDHILGFHGRAAGVIDALGVCSGIYGSPMHGGLGGDPFLDDLTRAKRIRRITIRHQGYIDAIQVHWIDGEDRPQEGVRHGGGGGKEAYFELEADEAIVQIRGRAGGFVDRLEFLTNKGRHHAFGGQGGEPFQIDIGPDRRLVGFWGRAGGYVDAIGVCLTPANELAAGKPASASSVYDDNYLPGRASDGGSAATGGWSPVYQPVGSWWQVDLGEARRLRRVEFVTRQDLDQPETRRNFQVWASNHRDMSEGHVVLAAHGDQPTPFRHVFSFPVNDPTPYRYVALVKVAPEYFFIAKVRVYGD